MIDHCLFPLFKKTGDLPNPEDAALCISSLAEAHGYSKTHVSPHTADAIAHGKKKEDYLGGKEDDITVIVAQVKLQH